MKKLVIVLVGMFVFLCLCHAYAEENIDVNILVKELQREGLIAQKGEVNKADIFTAVNLSLFPNCFDNNQNALYIKTYLPPAPGEKQLPPMYGIIEKDRIRLTDVRFRMRPDEAIILFGKTPKKCKYFSFTPYIFERYFEKDLKFQEVFNSLNDPLNNMTIKTDGGDGNPFDAFTVIVFTPDKGTEVKVRKSLIKAGSPENVINVSVIPLSLLRMGINFESDTLMCLFRIYGPEDEKALEEYVDYVPMQIYRVTPDKPVELDPFPMPKLRVRGTGKTEMELLPKMEKLRKVILEKYEKQGWKASEYAADQWLEEGLQALQAYKNMFGENRDTAYMSTNTFTMYDNEFIVIYGVDHTQTGKAVYCSAAVYGEDYYNGVAGSNSMEWGGSSNEYLNDDPDANKFFVLTSSRTKNLPDDGPKFVVPTHIRTEGVHKYKPIFVGFRNYLEKKTKSGPIPEEMISPCVIKFSKPAYPPVTNKTQQK
jgi:hypothetical protein